MLKNIEITRISDDYKCIVEYNNKKYFIDGVLPGDIVNIEINKETNKYSLAKVVEFIKLSDARIEPKCSYFNECGGCDLQYMNNHFYYKTKIEIISRKLSNSGFKIPEISIFKVEESKRRKINLKYSNGKYGFFRKNSNDLVEIKNCLCICSELNEVISELKNIKFTYLDSIDITKLHNGIHLIFNFSHEPKINEFSQINFFKNIAEVGYTILKKQNYKTVFINQKPTINLDGLLIELPSKYFIQPTNESQQFIINTIKNELKNYKNIVDLYCGLGTYSFPLSRTSNLVCFESENIMVNSIKYNKKQLNIENIKTFSRDLFSKPLQIVELNEFDVAIINPPRNGAEKQCKYLSQSNLEKIIYISCNPKTLSRDLKLFVNSYHLDKVIIVDQFYWSKHTECITVLVRK